MKRCLFIIVTVFILLANIIEVKGSSEDGRLGKLLPIFQVVRFPNDVCAGTTRNGTCFTAEECSNKGGVNEGSCASGFGVCCVLKLACGDSTTANNSYIVQTSVTTLTSPCTYSICPCSKEICRIRYDFTAHTLADQVKATTAAAPAASAVAYGGVIGDCGEDQFSITSPGTFGSPVICGQNTGQHMILDSDGTNCQTANFMIGGSTTTSRVWDIYVTQYTCSQEDEAGPPGCLQYFTGTAVTVKNFGFPTGNTATTTATDTTHLSNQNYDVCVRREKGYCYGCWGVWGTGAQFGLSISDNAAAAKGTVGTSCIEDYVTIPFGSAIAIAMTTTVGTNVMYVDKFCGRFLNTVNAETTNVDICTRSYPYRLGVTLDNQEMCTIAGAMADTCEFAIVPGGILGFALTFTQSTC